MASYQLGDNVLMALIKQESGGNSNAVSSKGARGLTQIMPATAKNPGYGVKPLQDDSEGEQIRFARDYMGALLKENKGNLNNALAAYNAGQGNVNKYGGVPPFKETQGYIKNILRMANPIGEASAGESMDSDWVDDPSPQAQAPSDDGDWVDDQPQIAQAQPPQEQGIVGHKTGVTARGIIEGVAAIPENIYNTTSLLSKGAEKIGFGSKDKWVNLPESIDTAQYGASLADKIGLPQATPNDNIIYPVSKAVGGFALPAGILGAGGKALNVAKSVGVQLPGILAGQTASEIAKESGASPMVQAGVNIAGNVIGGKALGMVSGAARAGTRAVTGGIGTQKGLEGVAGRTLNRAAGGANIDVINALESGKVPTIKSPIPGYSPKTTEIAGNPGVSTIMRQTSLNADNLTEIGQRNFDNMKAVSDYALKKAGNANTRDLVSSKVWQRTEQLAEPMRARNKLVDLMPIRTQLDDAITRHTGNSLITSALEKVKGDLPTGDSAPFNTVLNFKQGLDQALRAPAMADPAIASLQRAASALKGTKSALTNTLTETEPEFRKYVTQQARGMQYLDQSEKASKILEKSRMATPTTGMTSGGQSDIYPLSGAKLKGALSSKAAKDISPRQLKAIDNAQQHAALSARAGLGAPIGSNTAQNLSIKDMVYNDLLKAGFGESNNLASRIIGGAASRAGSLPGINNITSSLGQAHADKLSKIFTKAELDPKYAAQLMKTYGLGHMNFSDSSGRAALRSLITQAGQNK